MNIRVLFYNVFLFLAFLSCSHDGDKEIDGSGDGSLSLRITISQIGTRADGDASVERLYVAVFGTSGENTDKLIVASEVTRTNTVEDLGPLKAGSIRMLVIANAPVGTFDGLTSLDQYLALTQQLENQETNPAMSSGVQTYLLKPGRNTIGMQTAGANQISASPVTVYRTAARVYLNRLYLRPVDEYADEAAFKLESVFMANVKSSSHYISEQNWGTVEVTDRTQPDLFLSGEEADLDSICKVDGIAALSDALRTAYLYDYRGPEDETALIANCAANTYTVFENMQEEEWHTMLIIRGSYRFKDKNGKMQEVKNTYYPVVVNRQHDTIDNVTEHRYIRRNVIYSIDVVIKGPGSNNPFDFDATLTSKIAVQAWGEVVENPSID